MKRFKKLASFILAAAMVLTMGLTAFAMESSPTPGPSLNVEYKTGNGNIELSNVQAGSTYKVFKLADLGYKESDNSIIHWALNEKYLNADVFKGGEGEAVKDDYYWTQLIGQDSVKSLTYEQFLSNVTQQIANIIASRIVAIEKTNDYEDAECGMNVVGTTATTSKQLSSGYYIIIETETNGAALSTLPVLVPVINENVTGLSAKSDTPKVNKVIVDDNSKEDTAASVAGIGDKVQYRLDASVPKYPADASGIEFYLTDTASKGLTVDLDSIVVKAYDAAGNVIMSSVSAGDGVTLLSERDAETHTGWWHSDLTTVSSGDDYKGGNSFSVYFNYEEIKEAAYVSVEYSATLNQNAKVEKEGSAVGNPNKVELTYTNNYNSGTTHTTPGPEVKTYTFQFSVHKYELGSDGVTRKPLAGAKFAVYRVNEDGEREYVKYYSRTPIDPGDPDPAALVEGESRTFTYGEGKTATGYVFTTAEENCDLYFAGLDEGTYYIEEVEAPSTQYNLADTFTVEVKSKDVENDSQVMLPGKTKAKNKEGANFTAEAKTVDGNSLGSYRVEVENSKDITLPSTGGIGTTIFYVLGALLVVIAGVVLVTRRRMNGK